MVPTPSYLPLLSFNGAVICGAVIYIYIHIYNVHIYRVSYLSKSVYDDKVHPPSHHVWTPLSGGALHVFLVSLHDLGFGVQGVRFQGVRC